MNYEEQFDNLAEELFYDFLNDYEITSMIKGIEPQVWVIGRPMQIGSVRVDFLLKLKNGNKIAIEFDGSQHYTREGMKMDYYRDLRLNDIGIVVEHIDAKRFFKDSYERDRIAGRIEGLIDLLDG